MSISSSSSSSSRSSQQEDVQGPCSRCNWILTFSKANAKTCPRCGTLNPVPPFIVSGDDQEAQIPIVIAEAVYYDDTPSAMPAVPSAPPLYAPTTIASDDEKAKELDINNVSFGFNYDRLQQPTPAAADIAPVEQHIINPNEITFSIFGQTHSFPRFRVPQFELYKWFFWLFGLSVTLAVYGITMYYFLTQVVYFDNGKVKPFKGACFTNVAMENNLCFFSAGQLSKGIICLGQLNIGLVSIGQASVGLLFAFGQVAVGWGVSIGQGACGLYVPCCQFGFALYKVLYAQLGLQVLKPFFCRGNEEVPTPFANCNCG